jgi:hypothetical protein
MATGTSVIAEIRDLLDEQTPSAFTNTQLRRWINRGLMDMARVTRHFRDRTTISLVAGTAEYTVPANVLEIELAYYLPGNGQYVPLVARQFEGMDAVWASSQNQMGGYPNLYTTWGFSPTLKIRLYPVPAVTGHSLSLMVVRTPVQLDEAGTTDSAVMDFPDAWMSALVNYAEYCALRKDRDPRWQEAKQLYDETRDQLTVMGDYLIANREMTIDPYSGGVPRWLSDPNY